MKSRTSRYDAIDAVRPMRQLLDDLASSASSSKSHRRQLAQDAVLVMNVCQNGLGALGKLVALTAPEIDDGTVGSDSIEALGWLMSELGDVAAYCAVLSTTGGAGDGRQPRGLRQRAAPVWRSAN